MRSPQSHRWFEGRLFILFLVFTAAIPLLLPSVPPLTDLPGHIGRYKIEVDLARSPYLQQWYSFRWVLLGNLAVDLLILPLSQLLPLEMAVKLVVITIPPLTVAGMLYLAREIHGRIPATAFFALPLAYAFPFQLGFVNFTLAMAMAFLGAGLWLHLGRLGRIKLRAALFALFSVMIFLAHAVAWAIFGVVVFAVELMDRHQKSHGPWPSLRGTVMAMAPLATPIFLIISWMNREPAGATVQAPWQLKLFQVKQILRDRIFIFDVLSAIFLYTVAVLGLRRIGVSYNARLGLAALILFILYIVTPGAVKGVYYADARILPYALAVALLAISPVTVSERWRNAIAGTAVAFFLLKIAVQTTTYYQLDHRYREHLAALDQVPRGARILAMVELPCEDEWQPPRTTHLASLAIARREAYVNGMWPMPGGRLMSITYAAAAPFHYSPSQILWPPRCRSPVFTPLSSELAKARRDAFDYLWLIDVPSSRWPARSWLTPVWHGKMGILYRIGREPLTTTGPKT